MQKTAFFLKKDVYLLVYHLQQMLYNCISIRQFSKLHIVGHNHYEWGWKMEDKRYEIVWRCKELIFCGCKHDRGCPERCKCIQASLPCTPLFNCGGDCER